MCILVLFTHVCVCVIDVNLKYDKNDIISFFTSYCRAVLFLVGCISVTFILSREINIHSAW